MYRVRQVDPGDPFVRDLILELDLECFSEFESKLPPPDVDKGDWWLVYDADGHAVGHAGLYASVREEGVGYLCRSGVLPQARGHRLQRRLIRAREALARSYGWTACVSDTAASNPWSSNNLIACGYRLWWPEVRWGFSSGLYWRREL